MTTPIPQPPGIPFLGNITALDKELPLKSFQLLSHRYGEIFQLSLPGRQVIFASSYALVNELSDEKRFRKAVTGALGEVRNLVSDGLFTAHNDEPNWAIAHRLLMPAFGTASIRSMLEDMRDISSQLLLKWERFGPDAVLDPVDDYTRVALDTIAFCSMSHRLNSFYTETQPVFAKAMADFLKECFARANRPSIVQVLMTGATAKYDDDIRLMTEISDKIVAERRAHPTEKKDLLNAMLNGRDPKTGQGLSDENITKNLLTFLIAGHETSSGTLSFVTYYLLKHPDTVRKLQAEIDEVIGDQPAQYEDLSKMKYLNAVLREGMRLQPPAAARIVAPLEDTTLRGGKYFVKAGAPIVIQTWDAHRDASVWGEDVNEFRPERMLDGKFEALPPNAWQPFGYGLRACIGRPFAWQEMLLVLTSIFQKFDLLLADPSYTLEHKQALTIKPKDFYIRARPRTRGPHIYPSPSSTLKAQDSGSGYSGIVEKDDSKQPLYVLYGSNTGTSEAFAQRIATDASAYGFYPTIGTLDSATGHIPTDGPVVIVTASFEGEPADNAAQFVDWLTNLKGEELVGVSYGIFGCGNHDWVQTYQRIPQLCDELLEQRGGKRLINRGEGDAADGNFFQVFDQFEDTLFDALCKEYQTSKSQVSTSAFNVKTVGPATQRAAALRQSDAALGRVVENVVLTKPGTSVKRHIEFELPEGTISRAGDYLAILPHNPPRDVHRVLAHFSLSAEQEVVVSSIGPTSLPVGKAVTLSTILSGYVELSQPATTRDLRTLTNAATSDATRDALKDFTVSYAETVLVRRLSVVDILENHGDIDLPLSTFLQMLPAMRVRQYSISSSPLWNPQHVTLTISIVDAPATSGKEEPFLGVASNYLASLRPGDRVQMAVRASSVTFHPPVDPTMPVVMFCAGSGLAPMRGFIQERAVQKQSGREVAKMLLFFGCRSPEEDYLYSESDLAEWSKLGVVDVRPAFSRSPKDSGGCKYVQDRIWQDREDISKAYNENAAFFTCGSGKIARGIKSKLIEIIKNDLQVDEADATAKFERITKGRYATDIFE